MLKLTFRSLERGAFNVRTCRVLLVPTPSYPRVVLLATNFCTTRTVTTRGHQKRPEINTTVSKKENAAPVGLDAVKFPSLVSLEETTSAIKEKLNLQTKKKKNVQTKRVVISSEPVTLLSPNQARQAAIADGPAEEVGDTAGGTPTLTGTRTAGKVTTKDRRRWTSELDALLKEGVALYTAQSWAKVAEHVGNASTAAQCKVRWNSFLCSAQQEGINLEDWTDEEIQKLEELVPQYVIKPYWSERYKRMTKGCIDWAAIGRELNRIPNNCKRKWNYLQYSTLKQGSFTAEEDALIAKGVAELGDKGNGLWVDLERKMGRPSTSLSHRWNKVLKPRILLQSENPTGSLEVARSKRLGKQIRAHWTKEMDNLLKEGVAMYRETEGWARVAEHVGHGLTGQQCNFRWKNYLCSAQQKDIKYGGWSTEESLKLEELVPQHVMKPYRSETLQVQSKDRISWVAIGKALDRSARDCQSHWISLQEKQMKKGRFTAEEDALIVQREVEWGDKGNGLWVSLQQELGRPASVIQYRWFKISDI